MTGQRFRTKHPGIYYRLNAKGERRYEIRYTDYAGKQVFKTVEGQLKDVFRERNLILERMHRGERIVRSKMTLEELVTEYLETQTAHLKEKTRTSYEYNLKHWVIPRLGKVKITELSVGHIAEFIVDMRKPTKENPEGYKRWTIQNCLTPMGSMFRLAVRKGWMSSNPIAGLDRQERPSNDQKEMRILSTDDIQQVLGHLTKTFRPVICAAVFTGLRAGELLSLDWADVDLLEGIIRVRESKTRAGVREVVIPAFLVQELAKLNTTGLVFQTSEGTQFSQRNVLRALHRAQEKAALPKTGLHSLRHTYASMLISKGADVTYVSKQLGHASPKITLGIYAHLFDGDKRRKEMREKMQEFAEIVG